MELSCVRKTGQSLGQSPEASVATGPYSRAPASDDTHLAAFYGNSKGHSDTALCQPCLPQLPQPGHFLAGIALSTACKGGSVLTGLHQQLWGPRGPRSQVPRQESWCLCGHQSCGFSKSLLHGPEAVRHGHEKDCRLSHTGDYTLLTLSHAHTDLTSVGIIMPVFRHKEMDISEV